MTLGLLSTLAAAAIGACSALYVVLRLSQALRAPSQQEPSRRPLTADLWLWEQEYGRWAQQQRAKEDL